MMLSCASKLVLGVLIAASLAGCHARPRERPVRMGPVDTGPGSVEFERRRIEGTWDLQSFAVTASDGSQTPVKASGRLTYDAFGNLSVSGTIEGPLPDRAPANAGQMLDYTGQVVIDPTRHEMRLVAPKTDRPVDPATTDAIGPSRVRRYSVDDSELTITFLDSAGAVTAVAVFKRAPAPW